MKNLQRGYQYDFSNSSAGKYSVLSRERKAKTMVAVIEDYSQKPLNGLRLLNVGGSGGVIDNYLADYFLSVLSVDIDKLAIENAKKQYQKNNLEFQLGDALNLQFESNTFDVVICSQVYEHVPSPEKMMDEIFRVLVPGGVCYFAASNRLMWNEPHYGLPLLSVIPRPLAHLYVRLAKKSHHYHELHYTYWGLKRLVKQFSIRDYTKKIIDNPGKYHVEYMLQPNSVKIFIARFIANRAAWLNPGYIWLLKKPS